MCLNSSPNFKRITAVSLMERECSLNSGVYCTRLRDLMKLGGVELFLFEVPPIPNRDALCAALFTPGTTPSAYCETIIQSGAIKSVVESLGAVITLPSVHGMWSYLTSYRLDGFLAELLKQGGAYHQFEGAGREAKRLAVDFCTSLFQERYENVEAFVNGTAWSSWFKGVAWDTTVMIFDKSKQQIWLMMVTDTD